MATMVSMMRRNGSRSRRKVDEGEGEGGKTGAVVMVADGVGAGDEDEDKVRAIERVARQKSPKPHHKPLVSQVGAKMECNNNC